MQFHKSAKPLVWLPFAAGGVVAAMLLPAMILVTGILHPLGLVDLSFDKLRPFLEHPVGKLVLLALIPCLWHGAHRFRTTLEDLGTQGVGRTVGAWGCYLFAAAFSLLALVSILMAW